MATMPTTSPASQPPRRVRIPVGAIVRSGGIAVAAATIANVVLYYIGAAIWGYNAAFEPVASVWPTVIAMIFYGAGAVVAFGIVARVSLRPIRTYRIVALVALILTILPDATLVGMPGATTPAIAVLVAMHIVAAIIIVGILTTRPFAH